jgi:hypothetical protein
MRLALLLTLFCAAANAVEPSGLDEARRQLQALDFSGALRSARAAIAAGGHTSGELAELYGIAGEAAAVVEGADAGERAFRAELVLAPDHAPPARSSPVVARPFARAREWVLVHGALHVLHAVAATPESSGYRVSVTVASDPLGMVAQRQLWWRDAGDSYTPAILDGSDFVIPLRPGIVEYWIELVDGAGNELATLGEPARPLRLIATAAAPPPARAHHPLRWSGVTLGVAGVALLSTGLALNLVYAADYGRLRDSCGGTCSPQQTSNLDVDRGVSIAGYAAGATLTATAVVLLSIDAWQSRRRADEPPAASPTREPPRPR